MGCEEFIGFCNKCVLFSLTATLALASFSPMTFKTIMIERKRKAILWYKTLNFLAIVLYDIYDLLFGT